MSTDITKVTLPFHASAKRVKELREKRNLSMHEARRAALREKLHAELLKEDADVKRVVATLIDYVL